MSVTEKPVDIWKDIQGFNGRYQISYSGQVRRVYLNGKTKLMAQFKKAGKSKKIFRDRLFVHLTDDNGKSHQLAVLSLMAKHYLGQSKPGQVPYHINRCVMDNWASNIEYIDRKKLGELTGVSSRRQTVIKINADCETVDCYSSAREAGRQNYMSYQTIMDRCNDKVKKAFAPDGYEYAWEDKEVSVRKAIRRIELSRSKEDAVEISRLKQMKREVVFDF